MVLDGVKMNCYSYLFLSLQFVLASEPVKEKTKPEIETKPVKEKTVVKKKTSFKTKSSQKKKNPEDGEASLV